VNTPWFKIYWTSWWDEDHRAHGCPVEINLHTRRWIFAWRPFEQFAQGGDRRGERVSDRLAHWSLRNQNPEIWEHLERRRAQ
jgi:hypothetical protein